MLNIDIEITVTLGVGFGGGSKNVTFVYTEYSAPVIGLGT